VVWEGRSRKAPPYPDQWGDLRIGQTPSGQFAEGVAYATLPSESLEARFPLSWSHSESDLEEGLIRHLETVLLELGDDFTFARPHAEGID
jgi:hypothetical protein